MAEKTNPQKPAAADTAQFTIQKVFVKDLSFEAPNTPQIFNEQWAPHIDLHLQSKAIKHEEAVHEVVLTVTVTAKLGDTTAFLAEVQQAGIFTIQGFAPDDLARMLGSFCPNLLFPFAREAVADIVAKGGFPQLLLSPVNFDAVYAHMQQQKQQGTDKEVEH